MLSFLSRAVCSARPHGRATPSDLTKDSKQTIVFFGKRLYFGVFEAERHEGLGIGLSAEYVYLWEFTVAPEHVGAFERAYGRDGEWVRLFRRAHGYLRTELHRDRVNPLRYLTIDYWESEAAYEAFRTQFATEFAALDKNCAEWTTSEREIGRFEAR